MNITFDATEGSLNLSVTQLVGTVGANAVLLPALSAGGTVNNFNGVAFAPLAPGTVAEVFGSGLATASAQFSLLPLPVQLQGTDIRIGNLPAPLFVASGLASPSSPLAEVTAQVTVDGQPAPVVFAGLTPGFVGLYQINFTVPTGARTGTLPLVVTQNGFAANVARLPVAP
jgi:hypothetical protein